MAAIRFRDAEFTAGTRDAVPAHFLFKIESFSLFSKHGIQKYESREFAAGGYKWYGEKNGIYKWRLVIYPDGVAGENENDHVSVYLAMADTSSLPMCWEVNALFSFFLYNQVLGNYLCFQGKVHRFNAMNPHYGFSKMLSKETLMDHSNSYLVDDSCIFGAEVFVQYEIEYLSLKDSNASKYEWVISNYSKIEDWWISDKFPAGGYGWKIALFPKGIDDRNMIIIVECVELTSGRKVRADYCFRIKNQLNKGHCSRKRSDWFTSSISFGGWSSFAAVPDMCNPDKGLVVNDKCVVEIEISVHAVSSN